MKEYREDMENRSEGEGLIEGRNAVTEALRAGAPIDKIYIARGETDRTLSRIVAEAKKAGLVVVDVDRRKLDTMSATHSHQGVIAVAAAQSYASVEDILRRAEEKGEKPLIVVCDEISDPHNLGAIIRTAECAGAHGVIIPKRRAVGLTAVVAKASAGAIEHMAIAKVSNLATTVEELKKKGLWIFASEAGATPYYETDFNIPSAIIFGSEGAGVSRLLKEKCDFLISIPMYGKVNSLNVSTAASVILCHAARMQHTK